MKIINIILAFGVFVIWLISLIKEWGLGVNVLLGIMFPLILFLDDLISKPINLIGWEIKRQEKRK
jgi:hypothetical protein